MLNKFKDLIDLQKVNVVKGFLCIFKVCNKKRLSGRKSRNLCSFTCRLNSRASRREPKMWFEFYCVKKGGFRKYSAKSIHRVIHILSVQWSEWKYRIHGISVKSCKRSFVHTVWKSHQKHDHYFYVKINIIIRQMTVFTKEITK